MNFASTALALLGMLCVSLPRSMALPVGLGGSDLAQLVDKFGHFGPSGDLIGLDFDGDGSSDVALNARELEAYHEFVHFDDPRHLQAAFSTTDEPDNAMLNDNEWDDSKPNVVSSGSTSSEPRTQHVVFSVAPTTMINLWAALILFICVNGMLCWCASQQNKKSAAFVGNERVTPLP